MVISMCSLVEVAREHGRQQWIVDEQTNKLTYLQNQEQPYTLNGSKLTSQSTDKLVVIDAPPVITRPLIPSHRAHTSRHTGHVPYQSAVHVYGRAMMAILGRLVVEYMYSSSRALIKNTHGGDPLADFLGLLRRSGVLASGFSCRIS